MEVAMSVAPDGWFDTTSARAGDKTCFYKHWKYAIQVIRQWAVRAVCDRQLRCKQCSGHFLLCMEISTKNGSNVVAKRISRIDHRNANQTFVFRIITSEVRLLVHQFLAWMCVRVSYYHGCAFCKFLFAPYFIKGTCSYFKDLFSIPKMFIDKSLAILIWSINFQKYNFVVAELINYNI